MTGVRIMAGMRIAPGVRGRCACHDGIPIRMAVVCVVLMPGRGAMSVRLVSLLRVAVMLVLVFHGADRFLEDQ